MSASGHSIRVNGDPSLVFPGEENVGPDSPAHMVTYKFIVSEAEVGDLLVDKLEFLDEAGDVLASRHFPYAPVRVNSDRTLEVHWNVSYTMSTISKTPEKKVEPNT